MEKPVIRPTIDAMIRRTDRSNGENFIVGKSLIKKDFVNIVKDIKNIPVSWAKLCISSEKN